MSAPTVKRRRFQVQRLDANPSGASAILTTKTFEEFDSARTYLTAAPTVFSHELHSTTLNVQDTGELAASAPARECFVVRKRYSYFNGNGSVSLTKFSTLDEAKEAMSHFHASDSVDIMELRLERFEHDVDVVAELQRLRSE